MYAIFDSDSEEEWLLLIQTSISYKLNSTILGTFTWQKAVAVEFVEVTKRLRTVEKTGRMDDLLLSVVDETMRQIFKDTGAKVIYNYLTNNSHLKLEEIAEKPEVFSSTLKMLLGSGAQAIEISILKNMYSKLGLKFETKKGYGFSNYIQELKSKCESTIEG